MATTVAALAAWLDGQVVGDGGLPIERAQALGKAGPGSITFFSGKKGADLGQIRASAVLVARQLRVEPPAAGATYALIVVNDPKTAFVKVAGRFSPRRSRPEIGISCDAYVSATAQVGTETNIHPGAHLGAGVIVGNRCDIHPGAVISRGCRLGDDVVVYPNAVLYEDTIVGNRVILHAGCIIGADGFGYRSVAGRHEHIPHFGNVRIEDDVEIGANSTIDRALIGETVIGQGTKLDNLVMIGHNCEIGRHNLFVSQAGLAGSVTTGDHVVCAGQVGVADHVRLGDRVVLGAKSGVHEDIPGRGRYIGAPAMPEKEGLRTIMAAKKVPEMSQQIRRLERQVAELVELAATLRRRIAAGAPNEAGVPGNPQDNPLKRDAA